MKTQEEIEELVNKRYLQKTEAITDSTIKGFIVSATKGGYIDGYTQCQEDMIKDVEYWQSESDHWYQQAMAMSNELKQVDIICPKCKGVNE